MQAQTEQIVTLTDKAIEKVKYFLEKEEKKDYGLRVGVVPGGCSAYMYQIEFEEKPKEKDHVIEQNGVKIFVNPESVSFMKGSVVDYQEGLTNTGFKVKNPNVKSTCGCGHSVS